MTAASISSYDLPSRMVSQPAPRALTVRGPASVSSRSATNRRHRGHRSHHGGSSYAPQNEFPNFAQTGDVEIVISADGQERRYMLHRLILSQCSGFFEAGTSEEWARAQAQTLARDAAPALVQRRGLGSIGEDEETVVDPSRSGSLTSLSNDRPRWRYELEWENNDDEMPMLVQKVGYRLLETVDLADYISPRHQVSSAVTPIHALPQSVISPQHRVPVSSAPWPTSPLYTRLRNFPNCRHQTTQSATMTTSSGSFITTPQPLTPSTSQPHTSNANPSSPSQTCTMHSK